MRRVSRWCPDPACGPRAPAGARRRSAGADEDPEELVPEEEREPPQAWGLPGVAGHPEEGHDRDRQADACNGEQGVVGGWALQVRPSGLDLPCHVTLDRCGQVSPPGHVSSAGRALRGWSRAGTGRSGPARGPRRCARRPRRARPGERRNPWLGSCSHGTGPWPFQPLRRSGVEAAVVAHPGVGVGGHVVRVRVGQGLLGQGGPGEGRLRVPAYDVVRLRAGRELGGRRVGRAAAWGAVRRSGRGRCVLQVSRSWPDRVTGRSVPAAPEPHSPERSDPPTGVRGPIAPDYRALGCVSCRAACSSTLKSASSSTFHSVLSALRTSTS